MKKMKKIFAVLLTLAMVLGMSMTTFATDPVTPSSTDSKDVTVSNVEGGAVVEAYQIIDAEYDEDGNGFTGYVWATGTGKTGKVAFDDSNNVVGLDSTFLTGLAKNTKDLGTPVTATVAATATDVTLNLGVGTWMILVTPPSTDAAKVYNPMIASVYYLVSGSDNTMQDVPVDANTNWTLAATNAYAKSSDISLEKKVNDDTREVGQEVTFTIKTTIPSYSDSYTNATFTIKDEIVNGLAYTDANPVVKVGGKVVDAKNYTLDKQTGYFTVTFKPYYLRGLAAVGTDRSVEIEYKATVTAAAVGNPAENTATLTYSDTISTTATKTATEKVFTFELDGVLKKVKEDQTTALAGAEFTLYRDSNLTDSFGTATSAADGNIKFEGIGAKDLSTDIEKDEVKYYLKETKAPNGYTINDTVYEIEIKNIVRDNNGDVTEYSVYVDGTAVATVTTAGEVTGNGVSIINTTLSALPGTGGIGTTIFTIGGCLIMIAAAGLFFASRRKTK